MGSIAEFSLEVRLFLMAYPWRKVDPTPWTPLRRPLSECKLALVSSAAFILPGQEKFTNDDNKGIDCSFRSIPSDVDTRLLADTHPSHHFDHSGIAQDINLAFPLDRVRELVERGRLGSLNHRHLSMCGAITAPGRLIRDTAPEAARCLVEDGVDVVLLVPV
jgi:D-proline reductase (dithiol) PrdB